MGNFARAFRSASRRASSPVARRATSRRAPRARRATGARASVVAPRVAIWCVVALRDATPAMPREVTRVGAYALKRTLGRGAFGWVKLAVQDETGAKAAIKVRRRARMDGWMDASTKRKETTTTTTTTTADARDAPSRPRPNR